MPPDKADGRIVIRTTSRDLFGVTLRIDWHVSGDLFDVAYGGESWERLTPYGLHCVLREDVRAADRTITALLRALGRRNVKLPTLYVN